MKNKFRVLTFLALLVIPLFHSFSSTIGFCKGVEGGGGGPSMQSICIPLDSIESIVLKNNRPVLPEDVIEVRLEQQKQNREYLHNLDVIVLYDGSEFGLEDIRTVYLKTGLTVAFTLLKRNDDL